MEFYVYNVSQLVDGGFKVIGLAEYPPMWTSTDLLGPNGASLDPKLDVLRDNGGPTATMALLAGSPAIDAGNSTGIATDQRGQTRPVILLAALANGRDGSDIGAFELTALPPPSLSIALTGPNTVVISWPSPSTGFSLQVNTDLSTANWVGPSETVNDNQSVKSITVSPATGTRFYRLKSQ